MIYANQNGPIPPFGIIFKLETSAPLRSRRLDTSALPVTPGVLALFGDVRPATFSASLSPPTGDVPAQTSPPFVH